MTRPENSLRRDVLFEHTLPIDMSLAHLDLDQLRRGFSELFDRAALAVHRAGHDLDDVIVERSVICRADPAHETTVRVDTLTDRERFEADILTAIGGGGASDAHLNAIHLAGLRVTVIHERWTQSEARP